MLISSVLPRLPTIGESLLASNFIFSPGGKGCNQALAASFADTDVYFITKVGTDHFSDYAINFMNSSKIYKVYLSNERNANGTATILVNEGTGDNVIAIYPGANMTMSSDEITIQKEAIIILMSYFCSSKQIIPLCNKRSHWRKKTVSRSLLTRHPIMISSTNLFRMLIISPPMKQKAGLLSGIDVHDLESAKRAAEAIHNKGVKNTVITLGSKGSLAFDGKKFIHSPAFPAVVKNTAGAGDAFNGALASGLAKGKSLESALCYASAFASLAVGDKQCFRHA
ncbi:ribokinase [Escherichia coli]|nr:ribokinase [Escherichia coli]